MSYIAIQIIAYAGYRANESPRSFLMNDETVTVVEILDKWIQENYADRKRKRFFVVRMDDGKKYEIYIDEKTSEWFCEIR